MDINGKKIAVVGIGVSNVSAILYLLKHDISALTVFDTRKNPPRVDELPNGIAFHLGPLNADLLKTYDMIVLSPGLSRYTPEIEQAEAAGTEVVGDVELFSREVKSPVIGITGSNGKSTVTTLVGHMADNAGIKVAMGANIGNPVFDILSDEVELYVLELSSFELETTKSLYLRAGSILNVSEDHLDRYGGSMISYAMAKKRIYEHCETCVYNRDDHETWPEGHGLHNLSFGMNDQEYGRIVKGSQTYLAVNGEPVLSVADLNIYGVHNEVNALAAMALADAAGIDRGAQLRALRSFMGLPHRCQMVRTLHGVSFYNDSKATNVASTEAAIRGLAPRHPEGIILLAGGLGKGQDFSPLKVYLGKEITNIFCFGRDAQKLLALDRLRCHSVVNMRQGLHEALGIARAGQAILLSPACASFDQFKGYEDRGRIFVSLVSGLDDEGSKR